MPRIDPKLLESVIYLYPSEADAEAGEGVGGSGFLVTVPGTDGAPESLYAVTNSHVIREAASPVIRLNTVEGGQAVIPGHEADWFHHPDGDDVAVRPLGLSPEFFRFSAIPRERFITQEADREEWHRVGPGDEVFMVGRFITYEGKQRNTPVARFGRLAMMPFEPIRTPRGTMQESFLVEMHSRVGFSGSPVIVRGWPFMSQASMMPPDYYMLLGIDWGLTHEYAAVLDPEKREPENPEDRRFVKLETGMSGVVPAWKLIELLDSPEVIEVKNEREKKHQGEAEGVSYAAQPPDSEFDRFAELTQKLVNTPKHDEDEPSSR